MVWCHMSFHTNAIKIDADKVITVVIAIIIIVYIIVRMFMEFDFSSVKDNIKKFSSQVSMTELYDYVENHPEYYYKIDDSVYCISKDELINSN